MCICRCRCMYMYIYTHTHIYIYTYIHIYPFRAAHMNLGIFEMFSQSRRWWLYNLHIHIHMFARWIHIICIHVNVYIHTWIPIRAYTCLCVQHTSHAYKCIQVNIHVHICVCASDTYDTYKFWCEYTKKYTLSMNIIWIQIDVRIHTYSYTNIYSNHTHVYTQTHMHTQTQCICICMYGCIWTLFIILYQCNIHRRTLNWGNK